MQKAWLALMLVLPPSLLAADAQVAWFTDATIQDAVRARAPADPLPPAEGTCGKGVRLVKAAPVEWPDLRRDQGGISFWVKPNWNGADGKAHRLLRIGDPAANGLLIEKSGQGMLRFVMASPQKVTASRYDVSHWKAGEWHQVTATWESRDGKPLGLALYLDEPLPGRGGPDALDGPLAAGNTFIDPDKLDAKCVWIGDESADAAMDELVLRTQLRDALSAHPRELVYRDFYRTGPFARIVVDPEPNYARSDRRVLAGHPKQFGLRAELRGRVFQITDFTQRYYPWGAFDAKPFITWQTSDPKVATVDANGLVTGVAPGRCKLTAAFRGLKADYNIEVVSAEQPDLDLLWLSRLPRYDRDAAKNKPAPGDRVETVAHIGNFGYQDVPAGAVVQWEIVPDANRNFRLDAGEKSIAKQRKTLDRALGPRESAEVSFDWTWTDEPTWVRVTLDPDQRLPDLCRANNQRQHLNIARPILVGFTPPGQPAKYHAAHAINLVGSFSYYDYAQAQFDCFEMLLREAVYPTTSPVGVQDSIYIDGTYEFVGWEDFEENKKKAGGATYDGHQVHVEDIMMAQNSGALHEGGHNALALPDVYSYTVWPEHILLKDPQGKSYAETGLLPGGKSYFHNPPAPAPTVGWYGPFMCDCHFYLLPADAGKVQYYRGFRGERFWGAQSRLLPVWRSVLVLSDLDDQPLRSAAVYVYQVANVMERRWIVDRPKFLGHTDEGGQFHFTRFTDKDWDNPETDDVEGKVDVWNPFGRGPKKDNQFHDVPFTPNVIETQGILLLKVVSDGQTEFHWVTDMDFQTAFLSGQRVEGRVAVRTSLRSSKEKPELVRPKIPDVFRQTTRAPEMIFEPRELVVPCGKEFTVDLSKSRSPQGQPLQFFWYGHGVHVTADPANPAVARGIAPRDPKEVRVWVVAFDGARFGEARIKIRTVADETKPKG